MRAEKISAERRVFMKKIGKLKIHTSNDLPKTSHVSIGFECLDRELFDPERCYDKLAAAGIKYARCQTGWCRCEKEKSVYTFEWLDSIVDNLLRRGIQPWFNVGFGNIIYMPDAPVPEAVGCVPTLYGENAVNAWKNYIAELAKRYRGKINYFEIWNEPDCSHFWFPGKIDGKQYAELVDLTGEVIKEYIPDAKIGACASNALPSGCRNKDNFMWDFASNVKLLDFFCLHRYEIVPEPNYLSDVKQMKKLFRYFRFDKLEIWNGECGYASWLPDDHYTAPQKGNSSEHQQAVGMLRYYFLDAAAGLERTSLFQTVDMLQKVYRTATDQRPNPARQGILNGITYTPKKVYESIGYVSTVLGGDIKPVDNYIAFQFSCRNPGHGTAPVCMAFEKEGKQLYAYYVPFYCEDETPLCEDSARVIIDRLGTCKEIEQPILIDMLNGDVFEIEKIETYGPCISYLNVNYGDYPMVICDRSLFDIVPE